MFESRKQKKYYLKEMQYGKITDKEVAKLFNTTVLNVRKDFVKFSQRKNPFKQIRLLNYFKIFELFITFISMLLVLFTLFEMQRERNNAYMPHLFFENTFLAVTWDKNGQVNKNIEDIEVDEFYKIIAPKTDYIDTAPFIKFTNIGMGPAEKITVKWDNGNLQRLKDYMFYLDKDINFVYDYDINIEIIIDEFFLQSTATDSFEITYMRNDTNNLSIMMPPVYLECIRYICCNFTKEEDLHIPDLELLISYYDIQGNYFSITKTLKVESIVAVLHPNGDGYGFISIKEK